MSSCAHQKENHHFLYNTTKQLVKLNTEVMVNSNQDTWWVGKCSQSKQRKKRDLKRRKGKGVSTNITKCQMTFWYFKILSPTVFGWLKEQQRSFLHSWAFHLQAFLCEHYQTPNCRTQIPAFVLSVTKYPQLSLQPWALCCPCGSQDAVTLVL